MKKIALVTLAILALSFTACGGGGGGDETGTAPTITTQSLPNGVVETTYNQTLTATGDTQITWSIETGSLPIGLSLSSEGQISGMPTTADTYSFTVKATNAKGDSKKQFTIVISQKGSPIIITSSLPNGTQNTSYSQTLSATGDATITWEIVTGSGSLPAGLSLSSAGAITGTPTTADTSNFTVKATNAKGSDTKPLSITITAKGNTLTDFTEPANYELLGLQNGVAGFNGSNVYATMEQRWDNSKNKDDGYGVYFYPIIKYTDGTINISGKEYKYAQIYSGDPMLRFILDSSNINIYGCSTGGLPTSFTFDIAVIGSENKGWFTAGSSKSIPGGFTPVEVTPSITISSITNGEKNNVSGLSGYKVYAIVKSSTRFTGDSISNLNADDYLKTVNVIRIYPDAEE